MNLRTLLIVALGLAAPSAYAAAGLIEVTALRGTVQAEQAGAKRALKKADVLAERDVLSVPTNGRISLDIGKHGFMELGADSALSLERVPFASYAADLRTTLRLTQGYLRVVWKHPGLSTSWPLFVYLGNFRVSLASGEYLFEVNDGKLSLCVADGEAAVSTPGTMEPRSLEGPSCYRLIAGAPPQEVQREFEDFVSARQDFALGALADSTPPQAVASADARIPFNMTAKPLQGLKPAPDVSAAEVMPPLVKAPPVASAPRPQPQETVKTPQPLPIPLPAPAAPALAASPPLAAGAAGQGSGMWILNIASFPEAASAEAEVKKLQAAGYGVNVSPAQVKGRTWYRVQLAGLESVAQARGIAEQISEKLGYKDTWVIRKQ